MPFAVLGFRSIHSRAWVIDVLMNLPRAIPRLAGVLFCSFLLRCEVWAAQAWTCSLRYFGESCRAESPLQDWVWWGLQQ